MNGSQRLTATRPSDAGSTRPGRTGHALSSQDVLEPSTGDAGVAAMRAAVISPDPERPAVCTMNVPVPLVPAGWVLVELRSAALNRLDAMTIARRGDLLAPSVIGADGAGVIVSLGSGVDHLRLGAEVVISPSLWWGPSASAPGPEYEILGSPTQGTHAGFVAVPADNVVAKPPRLSWDEAAALPLAGVTAWRALVTRGRLVAGETVVVGAASSGVGAMAIQIAVALGARVVAVSSSPQKLELARSLGAEQVALRTSDAFAEQLAAATGGHADLAVDPTGALWQHMLDATRPGGRLVVVGRMAAEQARVTVHTVFWKQLDIRGSSMGSAEDFTALVAHVWRSHWKPIVDSTFGLERVEEAYGRLDSPTRFGKVILRVSEGDADDEPPLANQISPPDSRKVR